MAEGKTVCFGRAACDKAATYISHHPDDLRGARRLASHYCFDHPDACLEYEKHASLGTTLLAFAPAAGGVLRGTVSSIGRRLGFGVEVAAATELEGALQGARVATTAELADGAVLWRNVRPGDPIGPSRAWALERLGTTNGQWQYIVTQEGKLVVGGGGHIDLSRGAPVIAAGEIKIVDGEVRMFNNSSGHYRPDASTESIARQAIQEQTGLPIREGAWKTKVG